MSALTVASPAHLAAKAAEKKAAAAAAAAERAARVPRLREEARQAVRSKNYARAKKLFAQARSLEAAEE